MELTLLRSYHTGGTNGILYYGTERVCYTIELPWLKNERGKSCIPEGCYEVKPRYSKRFREHYEICNVDDRKSILIHPANHARRELRGCIAPVSHLIGEGEGSSSRAAMNKLKTLVDPYFQAGKKIYLIVTQKN